MRQAEEDVEAGPDGRRRLLVERQRVSGDAGELGARALRDLVCTRGGRPAASTIGFRWAQPPQVRDDSHEMITRHEA